MAINRPRLCAIVESSKKGKKFDAIFREKDCPCSRKETPTCGSEEVIVSFGAKGMSDYTLNKDPARKERYLARHSNMNEDWNDPMTPGALSRWVLWNKPSMKDSIEDFKKRFKL